jgi:hypothetical protein
MQRDRRFLKWLRREGIPRTSDVQYRRVVRSAGIGVLEVVADAESGRKEFQVRSPWTKAPGSKLPTGRHVGSPGEFGLTVPPPGQRGAADAIIVEQIITGTESCTNYLGPASYTNLQVIAGSVSADADTVTCLFSGGSASFTVDVLPFTGGCFPSDVQAFAELNDGGAGFGTPHTLWSVTGRLLGTGNLGLTVSVNLAFINPTLTNWDGVIRLWSPSQGHLGGAFAPFNLDGKSGPNRVTMEI